MTEPKIAVLISANSEWQAVKEILSPACIQSSPFGETFNVTLDCEASCKDKWHLTLFHGGWGKISAAATAQYVIDHYRPDLLVNLGTCGGFEGRIERGTILLVTKTIVYDIIEQMSDPNEAIKHYSTEIDLSWLDTNRRQTIDRSPSSLVHSSSYLYHRWIHDTGTLDREASCKDTGKRDTLSSIVRGLLVSADRDILPADIPMLVDKYGAVAADWESGAIAWVAKSNGVRCLILRGVTDLVGASGGEAYGDIAIFHENTRNVMKELLDQLPGWLSAINFELAIRKPLFDKVDCIRLHVPDLESGLAFYRDRLGHTLIWRTAVAAGLRMPGTEAELVLQTEQVGQEVDITVKSADEAAHCFVEMGGEMVVPPFDIQIGRACVVRDPWGNQLVLLDISKGLLATDKKDGNVIN